MISDKPISTRCLDSRATGLRTPLGYETEGAAIQHRIFRAVKRLEDQFARERQAFAPKMQVHS